jgi:glyoxylase-like metal-dependent hydrolase (beta-lactamase superfamily II)
LIDEVPVTNAPPSGAEMQVRAFYDPETGTVSYLVWSPAGHEAAAIDPVLGFDARSGRTHTTLADQMLGTLAAEGLRLEWILETHAHADHLSAARHLQARAGGRVAIGEPIRAVQALFATLFPPEHEAPDDDFDHLFHDDETFRIGPLEARAIAVPGHTPADMAYQIGDAVFVGDTLFMPDLGSARADFPGGDARALYRSTRRLLALPPQTRLYVCHDYPPAGREPQWESTVAQQRAANIHVRDGIGEDEFVALREARDATLGVPALMLPSIQVNLRGGRLPVAEANGVRYLRLPLDALGR